MTSSSRDAQTVDWREVTKLVLRDRGITTGLWRVGVGFNFAAINAGPNEAEVMPTALASVKMIVLTPVSAPGPLVFDAAELNADRHIRARAFAPIASRPTAKSVSAARGRKAKA